MNSMKLNNFVILMILCVNSLVFAQNSRNSTAIDCKSRGTRSELDAIFARLYTFGDSGRSFPLNQGESTGYCSETLDLLKTAEVYVKNCLKEYPKRLLSIMIKTVRTQSKSLCSSKESKRLQELFIAAPCTNTAKAQYQRCIDISVDTLVGTKSVDDKQKLPLLCCGNHRMQKCFHDQTIKVNACDEQKIETSLRFLDSIQGNMISILCNKYDDSSDTCDKLVYPQRTKRTRRYKSIVLPMIQVLDSIKDEKARGI